MKRKLQIFVSSTYTDLLTERQAAVEAILRAGHIPAGMELFAAGDRSQLETITRWIDESDVYMLILGGRYGSVDKDSGKSYTQLEYEYAIATGKRFFAVVLSDKALDEKVKAEGRAVLEKEHQKELDEFRRVVMTKICREVDDSKDIKLAIHETILQFLRDYTFDGWVSGKDVTLNYDVSRELARLIKENAELRSALEGANARKPASVSNDDFDAIRRLLADEYLTYRDDKRGPIRKSVIDWFVAAKNSLVTGVSNTYQMSDYHNFLFFGLSPQLSVHGLTEDQKIAGVRWRTIKTTKKGNEMLAYLQKLAAESKHREADDGATPRKSSDGAVTDRSTPVGAVQPEAKPTKGRPDRKAPKKSSASK